MLWLEKDPSVTRILVPLERLWPVRRSLGGEGRDWTDRESWSSSSSCLCRRVGASPRPDCANGTVDAADIVSTDPAGSRFGLVPLEDPKHIFAAQNVVPVFRQDVCCCDRALRRGIEQ
ncbi:hypothetical protein OG331_47555 [Streptomyces sp. NBC_01017]|uniref:ABC-type glycine betaine transport system substrate-binding domain-containing protein n=2 Tax=unclassified Streptomyces TaxID=2593676 RepID=A0AAU1IC97_9ACTN|nr:hypothetical protein OG331_04425 [Streptomyces sp. NBC_01017]WSV34730.1 hypothetical protein OG331_47555 [Streptomyces sp. NBC_01017]